MDLKTHIDHTSMMAIRPYQYKSLLSGTEVTVDYHTVGLSTLIRFEILYDTGVYRIPLHPYLYDRWNFLGNIT